MVLRGGWQTRVYVLVCTGLCDVSLGESGWIDGWMNARVHGRVYSAHEWACV